MACVMVAVVVVVVILIRNPSPIVMMEWSHEVLVGMPCSGWGNLCPHKKRVQGENWNNTIKVLTHLRSRIYRWYCWQRITNQMISSPRESLQIGRRIMTLYKNCCAVASNKLLNWDQNTQNNEWNCRLWWENVLGEREKIYQHIYSQSINM